MENEMADDSSEIVKEQAEQVAASNLLGAGSVGFGNIKLMGDTSNLLQTLSVIQAQDAAVGWRSISQAIVGKVAESIINMSPGEGGADIAALGQLSKMLQGTPPPTNLPTQGT